jgi:4-amino-4-deoxy-L-arabinose transferase-like glycosyltransferase
LALGLALLVFAAIAPTLASHEFSSGMESLNVATAQEIRRTGNWLVPTLQGELRVNKPPLETWLTAVAISDHTFRAISSDDLQERERGFRWLAWEVRWTALLSGCLTLLITFAIGRIIFDAATGLVSMAIMASSLLFLRFDRYATTDVLLSFFVAATILLLLIGVLQKRWWIGLVGGGIALALAMMAKGPMALLQSAIPIAIFAAWRWRSKKSDAENLPRSSIGKPLLVGTLAFLVIGLSWYLLVWRIHPDVLGNWNSELTGYEDAAAVHASHWYTYFCLIPYMTPWLVFFIAAIFAAWRRHNERGVLLLLLLLTPLVVMSFFHDKYPRYLLPMLPAAALLVGQLVTETLRKKIWSRWDRFLNLSHWVTLAIVGIGFPIAAAGLIKQLHRDDGAAWLTPGIAIPAAVVAALVILAGAALQKHFRFTLVLATLVIMLAMQGLFIVGYERSAQGVAEYRPLAEMIVRSYPDAEVYNAHPRGKRPPPDVGVYMNRVLKWIADPSTLQPGEHPKVLLMLQDKNDPPPSPPPGWRAIGNVGRAEKWWAFVLAPTPR